MTDTQFTGGVSSPTPLTVTVKVDTIKMVRKKKKKKKEEKKRKKIKENYKPFHNLYLHMHKRAHMTVTHNKI